MPWAEHTPRAAEVLARAAAELQDPVSNAEPSDLSAAAVAPAVPISKEQKEQELRGACPSLCSSTALSAQV